MNLTNITPAAPAVIPTAQPAISKLATALERFGRERFEQAVELMIDVLDLSDGERDLEPDDEDTGVEDDPLGCDPETDVGADDVGEEDRALEAAVPAYGIDQRISLPSDDAVVDMPCADIAIARRPTLTLRYAGAAR